MTNALMNRMGIQPSINKSGGSVAYGAVVIAGSATAKSFTTTTTEGYRNSLIGVVVEPAGIANNATGLVSWGLWAPRINLDASASLYDFIKTDGVAGQGTPHAAPMRAGDFALALETGANPSALLFGSPEQGAGGFISEVTVTAGASLVISSGIDSTYDEYEIRFYIAPANDNVAWRIELSTDGGSTWLNSGYIWSGSSWYSNTFASQESSTGAAIYSTGEVGNASGEHVRGVLKLLNPLDTSYQKIIQIETGEISHQPHRIRRTITLQHSTLSAINALRFTFASGNIASGRARLYGIAKS